MRTAPAFWWHDRISLKAALLSPLSFIYGAVSGRRMHQAPSAHASLPVICIGNFVVGGAGKTPFALKLCALLQAEGHKPVFLLRGYGGRLKGPVLVDPEKHSGADVGDEAFLLAAAAPTIVAANRPEGAAFAATLEASLILMDDGFQNPALAKDLTLALVDAEVGTGNSLCLPAGPLRAPLSAQIRKADALVVVGEGNRAAKAVHLAARRGLPIIEAKITPTNGAEFEGQKVLAYAGIGRPQKFFASLAAAGAEVVETRAFGDHHPYSEAEAQSLLTRAETDNLQLVTTAKDMARIESAEGEIYRWLAKRSAVLEVDMRIEPQSRLMDLISETLRRRPFRSR
ncbi:tetraacyldisaccharide 4'-kinase [Pannonibacter phragmitetus]|uniref:Tetraacyldisaccharide 4'-kinase n=1 Tax=Pannonibacter phragmitetus TaxID=121719 RepID=A0A0U3EIH1_9HYPH|nr:tetraacyldisaccharide 4'-kinase [Pannonibacter phragmitetus]ALV25855.1 tetraacyldisaccharide 4'-kinase [Pannonibacter phragmitetus]